MDVYKDNKYWPVIDEKIREGFDHFDFGFDHFDFGFNPFDFGFDPFDSDLKPFVFTRSILELKINFRKCILI